MRTVNELLTTSATCYRQME